MVVDVNRIAASALEAFLERDESQRGGSKRQREGSRFGGIGAVALGAGLAVAARAAYNRARKLDLERIGGAIEEKLRH